jgi:C1A family cysteine protease
VNVDSVIAALDGGNPAVMTMLIGERFYAPIDGLITEGTGDPDTTYHAVVAVGHGKNKSERVILVRNSWSAGWGQGGHAWVTEAYIKPRLHAVALVSKTEMIS